MHLKNISKKSKGITKIIPFQSYKTHFVRKKTKANSSTNFVFSIRQRGKDVYKQFFVLILKELETL